MTKTLCTELFNSYARHVDFAQYDQFVELFTEDAVLDLGFRLEGKAAIARSMSKRNPELRSRHVLTNIYIEELDDTHATGIAYLSLYRYTGPETATDAPVPFDSPSAVGHYTNQFRYAEGGWKISSCKLDLAFRNPNHFD
ncbi:MAG: nuclear transport factor 2 family protein [Pseudomonadales bacterium]